MITEIYVSQANLIPLLKVVRADFVQSKADVTYGTIKFIQKDTESYLALATEPLVCIVCNLHIEHSNEGINKAIREFRGVIERAIEYGGRFYLTYHRWATRSQLEKCYPQFRSFWS